MIQLYSTSSKGVQEECKTIVKDNFFIFPGFSRCDAFLLADYQVNGMILFSKHDQKIFTAGTYINPQLRGKGKVYELWESFMQWSSKKGASSIQTDWLNGPLSHVFTNFERKSPDKFNMKMYDAEKPYYTIKLD